MIVLDFCYGILLGDAVFDGDNDELSNLEEYRIKVDPTDFNTDDDSLSDGDEVNIYKTDPSDSDTDRDGFNDGKEIRLGTDPLSSFSNLFMSIMIISLIILSVGTVSLVLIIIHRKRRNKTEKKLENIRS
ncbi:MAG: hypothetical protein ACFFC3_06350 [Candidatus Odinarchaeota archaeon]